MSPNSISQGVRSIRTRTLDIDSTLKKDLELYNPTLKSALKFELFEKNIEFGSKSQLLQKLEGNMKALALNVILWYLKGIGKAIDN